MTDSIFDATPDQATTETKEAAAIATTFIGEGKKYKTVEEADKAILHKEQFIETLKAEKQEVANKYQKELEALKAELAKRDALAEAADILNSQKSGATVTTSDNDFAGKYDPELMKKVAEEVYNHKEKAVLAKSNVDLVESKLIETYGARAKEIAQTKAKELGIDFKSLAATSPQAALELLIPVGKKASYEYVSSGIIADETAPLKAATFSDNANVFDFTADKNYQAMSQSGGKALKDKYRYVADKLRREGVLK